MRVQFIAPSPKKEGGEVPTNLVAEVTLIPDDANHDAIALGGIGIWQGDGAKGHAKAGELQVVMPRFGVFSPIKVARELCDKTGKVVKTEYEPTAKGVRQFEALKASILSTFNLAVRPYDGSYELSETERLRLAAERDKHRPDVQAVSQTPDELRAEVARLTAMLNAKAPASTVQTTADAHVGATETDAELLGLERATRPDSTETV